MLNDHLRHDVEEELRYEPRVDDRAIPVAAADGEVTLRGTVGSFRERREAVHATKRVLGSRPIATPRGGSR
jgi:osmotically-inducible protein OsmY